MEIGRKSVELKMMMQRSKEGYCVETFNIKENSKYSSAESFADSIGVEGARDSDASDEISYVLFGGLGKYATPFGPEKKVLVKAEVILKKKKSR